MDHSFPSDLDLKSLVKELSEGRDLAKQLQNHLNLHSNSSYENREFLVHRILYSYDQALTMLSRTGEAPPPPPPPPPQAPPADSPVFVGSPNTDDSDQDKDPASRKRKAVPKWTKTVKVSSETGIEGQLDDGYGWRKYGQKDILGAKYPRGYYRCTNRHGQGCLATKYVQISNDDPTLVEVTYRGKHTCNVRSFSNNNDTNPTISMPDPQNKDPNPLPQNQQPFNIQTNLRVISQDLDNITQNPSFDPFDFPPSSTNFLGDYNSQNLVSPLTSGSNFYPISTDMGNNYGGLQTSGSELSPIIAAVTSATNSPTIGTSFTFSNLSEFGSTFDFENPKFYP